MSDSIPDLMPARIKPSSAAESAELAFGGVHRNGAYGIWTCLVWVAALRMVIFAVGMISVWTASQFSPEFASGKPWIAFDAMHYESILRYGYQFDNENWKWIAYFPGYPLVGRLLSTFMPPVVAMLLISNACAMAGFGIFYTWAKELLDARIAFISTLILATFPAAVFYSSGTTEAPFMMLTGLALLLATRKQWYLAASTCAVASFTRPTAAALGIVLLIAFLIQSRAIPVPKRLLHAALLGIICISGMMAYQSYLVKSTGDYQIYTKAQKTWEISDEARRKVAADLSAKNPSVVPERESMRFFVVKALTPQAWNRVLALGMLVITLIGMVYRSVVPRVWFLMPLVIFLLGYLPNHGLRASSVVRYEMASLPVFLLVGWWFTSKPERRNWLIGFLTISMIMQVYYAFCFGRGIWVG